MTRVRFAPSPTGELHLGGARTALFNYLVARQMGGKFIIRIEDTDQERFVEGSQNRLLAGLKWLGLNWDEGPDIGGFCGPYIQSERIAIYKKYVEELVTIGAAYYCFCTSERLDNLRAKQQAAKQATMYDRTCCNLSSDEIVMRQNRGEACVVRLKVPVGTTKVTDSIRGEIVVQNSTIDDQVLMKSDGYPTYHLANVVDDHLMNITHVIRGEEWLPSTPKHVLLYKAFGWFVPKFTHLPNVLNDQRAKLSKRKDGAAVWVQTYQTAGYLPEAFTNYLALLGWHPSNDTEIFSLPELVEKFDITRVQKAGAIFNLQKLHWFNAEYIKKLSVNELNTQLTPFYNTMMGAGRVVTNTTRLTKILQTRLVTLHDVIEQAKWFFANELKFADNILIPKNCSNDKVINALNQVMMVWSEIGEWEINNLRAVLETLVQNGEFTRGELLWPVRVALTDERQSPDVYDVAWCLEKDETLKRILNAVHILKITT